MSVAAICGDVGLHNRAELIRALDLSGADADPPSDLALAARAYERWGEACPGRLLGDFSFAVRDARDGSVFAARDPLGVKPLYYRVSRETIAISTTSAGVGAADGLPLELDPRRVADALVPELESSDRTSTFYRDVHRLPPAHHLTFVRGRLALAPYWAPDPSGELRLRSDEAYAEAFREVFTEAVRCRLDGGGASMLSGGLDSSAIVGFARTLRERLGGAPLTTLSAVSSDPGCEETRCVRSVLTLRGLDPVCVRPDEIASFGAEIERFLESIEEPFDASMILPLLMYAAAARRGIRAVLDGVDGDSVASLEPAYLEGLLARGSWGQAAREATGLARFYRGSYAPWSSAWRLLIANAGRAFAPDLVRVLSRRVRRSGRVACALSDTIVSGDFAREIDLHDRLETLWAHRASRRQTARERHAIELSHPNIPAALERYHRVAASQGIEARHPFMDRRVVEFCLSLPWDQKVRDGWSKLIVRRACHGLLPDDVRWRRGRWVRLGPEFLAAAVSLSTAFVDRQAEEAFPELAPFVDRRKLLRQWADFRRDGNPHAADTIWRAASLNSWMRNTRLRRYDSASRANGPAALPRVPLAGRRDSQL